jgi:hypothetical protein
MSKLGAVVAGFLALATAAVAFYAWFSLGGTDMDLTGYLMLIAGGVLTLGLAGGLMALLFYSHRAGFDDRAGAPMWRDEPPPAPPPMEKPK